MNRNPPPLTVNHITDAIARSGIAVSQEGDNLYYFMLGDTQYALVSADHVKYGAAWSEEYHANSTKSVGNASKDVKTVGRTDKSVERWSMGVGSLFILGVVFGSYWLGLGRK